MVSETPRRGEVWLVALGAARAGEAGKTRPALLVSVDALNTGAPEELVVVVPLSSSLAPSALRIDIEPIAGLDRDSRAICRAVRSVAASRLLRRLDRIGEADMARVEEALSLILGLEGGG